MNQVLLNQNYRNNFDYQTILFNQIPSEIKSYWLCSSSSGCKKGGE